uniref:Uncharacterized protein n=1 Tax=Panagrolaimus superbus TaxID=310955 RepID=A0A914XUE0_9BILA
MNPPIGVKAFCENVEFLTFNNRKVCYRGYCKIYLNETLQQLIVVPSAEAAKVISASYQWNFVLEENILFVESPSDILNFVLVFDDPAVSKKVFCVATKNMFINYPAKQITFKQKFFIPFMDELNNPKETEILTKFLGFCSDSKKRGYLDMMINKRSTGAAVNRSQQVTYLNNRMSVVNHNMYNRSRQITIMNSNPMITQPQAFTHRKRHYPHSLEGDRSTVDDDENSNEPIIIQVIPKKAMTLPPPIPETYQTYDFKLIELKIKENTKQKLYIFADDDKSKCHTYVKQDSETLFSCHDCRFRKKCVSTAELKTNSQGKDYVEVKPNGHPCPARDYVPGRHAKRIIIKKPEYEVLNAFIKNSTRQRLIIFDPANRELCYEYFPHRNAFQCGGCVKLRKDTRAQIYHNDTDKEYVELYTTDHICELRPYNPEKFSKPHKIIRKPEYEIQSIIKNGKELKRLIVFDPEDNEYCYEYVLRAFGFTCKECLSKQHTASATLTNDKEGNECVRLGLNEHICESKPYVPEEKKEEVIIESEDFEVVNVDNQSQKVVIYDRIDRNLTYEFLQSSGDLYYCSRCKLKKHHLGIKLIKKDDGEYCIKMDADIKHVCEPHDDRQSPPLKPKIIKASNFFFYLNQEGKQRLAVFIDDDRTHCYTYYLSNTDNRKKFVCGGCSTFDRRPSARVWKNDSGEIYLELGVAEHLCSPKEFSTLEQTIVKKLKVTDVVKPKVKSGTYNSNFELRCDKKGERGAVLIVFHSKDKKLCYKFRHQKFNKKYRCVGCEELKIQVTAKLVDDHGKKVVLMGHNEHYCKPIKYQAEPPKFRNFLVFENDSERRGTKLIVFTSEVRNEYFEYSLWKGQKYFHCLGCYPMKSTIAKLFEDEKGEKFVEFGKIEHVCNPKVYDSDKFGDNMRVPDYQYEILPNAKAEPDARIILFNPDNYSLGYDYVPDKFFCCLKCRSLKKYTIAKLIKKENGERYLELSKNEHVCGSQNFTDTGRIYYESDYIHDIDYDGNHTVTTICPENRESWYKFEYNKDLQCFYCVQCKEEKGKITAAKIKVCPEKHIFILAYSHCCTPLSI